MNLDEYMMGRVVDKARNKELTNSQHFNPRRQIEKEMMKKHGFKSKKAFRKWVKSLKNNPDELSEMYNDMPDRYRYALEFITKDRKEQNEVQTPKD